MGILEPTQRYSFGGLGCDEKSPVRKGHNRYNGFMEDHYRLLADTKQQYREMFRQAAQSLEAQLMGLRPQFNCPDCDGSGWLVFSDCVKPLHIQCGYRAWQAAALRLVETHVGGEILAKLQQIESYKNTFSCHMCGACCRMASTDAPYEEMRRRAEAGDDFARQFISVFLPYESRQKAREKAPDIVEAVLAEAGLEADGDERIFFYHCPYVGEDNRCTVFGTEKRPAICGSYPETPLSFVYKKCAWKPWKDQTHTDTLLAHGLLAFCTDLSQKLRVALDEPPTQN